MSGSGEPQRSRAPRISVVMPVYNAEAFVGEAIRSILAQRFTDLEFIIVNDGSTDGSSDVIRSFTDPRIRVIDQEQGGVVRALNAGLAAARGEWIARHDADDIALPDRLERQLAFAAAHPEIGLMGTWATVIDPEGRTIGSLRHPTGHAAIAYALLFDSAFVHPSVMFLRSLVEQVGTYPDDPAVFEDHAMWSRMARATVMANLPEELVRYRHTDASASRSTGRTARTQEQRRRNFRARWPGIPAATLEALAASGMVHPTVDWNTWRTVAGLLRNASEQPTATRKEQRAMRRDAHARHRAMRLIPHHAPPARLLNEAMAAIAWNFPVRWRP